MPDTGSDHGRPAMEVAFARFEGSVSAEIKNLAHDVKNLVASLAAYATTRDLAAAESRIDKLERAQTWLIRTIAGALITASVSGVGGLVWWVARASHP
ncbi:hemolysin XhlA family protein [Methylobacterium sp. E-046]|uniref:hemolysin XhlA family protein n=1 Tax=Methylobacterium sp. E-046 TaxID=2836576 RepID=UPI001FBAD1F0|nr:hemolysin XhlA family protein [Methylobacterium sp. E-046]MCJ2102479.1 hemolysin XhlA family protein [Methylobacterium sp. E-046]